MTRPMMAGYALILALPWLAPLASIVNNQLNPSYETALGVAFGFMLGCAVHVVMILLWVAIRRSKLKSSEFIPLLLSFVAIIALTVLSNGGGLSKI